MNRVVRVIAATMVAVLLVGCAGSSQPASSQPASSQPASSQPASSQPASSQPADVVDTITYGIWDPTTVPAFEKILTEFNKSHPNIKVDIQVTPYTDFFTKLQTAISSKTEPDAYWLINSFDLYMKNGVLAPLGKALEANSIDLKPYPAAALDPYRANGDIYALPWTASTDGLWFNKQLFDKARVGYPTASWTWEDVERAAKALTDKSAGIFGIATPPDLAQVQSPIFQAGGSIVEDGKALVNSPEATKAVDWWASFVHRGESPTLAQLTETPADAWFQSEKVAMYQTGVWMTGTFVGNENIRDSVDVAPLPAGPAGHVVPMANALNVVSANSDNLDAAGTWVAFLATDFAQKTLAAGGSVFPANVNAQSVYVDSFPSIKGQVFLDQIKNVRPFTHSASFATWEKFFPPTLAPLWDGTQSAQEASNTLNAKIQEELDKE